jgi:hypothetical protein
VVLLLALPVVHHGCASPTEPIPPGGGQSLNLDYTLFAQSVEPVLVQHGCDATGDCHGGGIRGTLQLSAPGAKDTLYDFNQVRLQVWAYAPESSPILTEPLSLLAGGTPHSFKPFSTTGDPGYEAFRAWIMDGVTP